MAVPDADALARMSYTAGLMRGVLSRVRDEIRHGRYDAAIASIDTVVARVDRIMAGEDLPEDFDLHPRQDER